MSETIMFVFAPLIFLISMTLIATMLFFITFGRKLKRFVGEIIFTGGIGLFVYHAFDLFFGHIDSYYKNNVFLMLSIGVVLMTAGFFIMKNQRKSS